MDKLVEAQKRKWVLIEIANAPNPKRADGKFQVRRWGLLDSQKFAGPLLTLVQDIFATVPEIKNVEKIEFADLQKMGVDWGKLIDRHLDFLVDIIVNALTPNFETRAETINWMDDNIDFFVTKNAVSLIRDIFLLQFGKLESKKENPVVEDGK